MYTNEKISHGCAVKVLLKTFTVIVFFSTTVAQQVLGQLADDFSDGDFTLNPIWSGFPSHFFVNGAQQLQLNNTVASTSYLSTPFVAASLDDLSWQFYVRQSFSPSVSNFGRVYLASDQADLATSLNGYYLQFGEAGSNDAVELFRQTGLASTSVCRATNGGIATSFTIRLKVTRDNAGLWQLFIDYTGSNNLLLEASGTDNIHTASSFFGVRCTYTATNANKFFYDDFSIVSLTAPDTTPPEVQEVTAPSSTQLSILFSEDIDGTTAENVLNYSASHGTGNPVSALLGADLRTGLLSFEQPFPNGVQGTLSIEGVKDLSGNSIVPVQKPFLFFQAIPPNANDIVITEIFADPSPQVGLPEAEFVEIFNRSTNPFDLSLWKITDGSSTGNLSSLLLLPGEYLVLSTTSVSAQFDPFGKRMGVPGFPSLNNSTDVLVLKDPFGVTIDSVHYSSAWYRDDDKSEGGWSLELIDPDNVCADAENWIASNHPMGGSPGSPNSVFSIDPDVVGPKLLSVAPISSFELALTFNEKLAHSVPFRDAFTIQPPLNIDSVLFMDGTLSKINLVLSEEIDSAKVYTLSPHVYDCPGNEILAEFNTATFKLDNTAPILTSLVVNSSVAIGLAFSEKLNRASAENILHYQVISSGENPASVLLLSNQKEVMLLFSQPFVNGAEHKLLMQNIEDLAANTMSPVEKSFMFFEATPAGGKDVIITEIFADPSPQAGLPEAEFVELYNRSNNPFDLSGWTFSDGSVVSTFTGHILLAGEYMIVCPANAAVKFSAFGKTSGMTTFPSLNNSGDALVVRDAQGVLVDSVHYDDSWYRDEERKDGGWTLEIIDPQNTCAEAENWIAAEDESGGTPGKQNSVFAEKPDLTGPRLTQAIATEGVTLLLKFNEKLSKELPEASAIVLSPTREISHLSFKDASLTSIQLALSEPLEGGVRYAVTLNNLYDCAGNIIAAEFNRAEFALAEEADSLDIVINEILFNPRPTGVDFVEVYNRSARYFNLKDWRIANIDNGETSNEKVITSEDFLMAPGSYHVLTESGNVLKGEYLQGREETFLQTDLPSFPDDEGSVVLIDDKGEVIDHFSYDDKLHSVFIRDDEGVSLERIDFSHFSNEANWKSASSASGFATPGYLNSNFTSYPAIDENVISVEPEVFSPLQGQPDFAQIRYNFEKGGYVANVKIIDPSGRAIQQLASNELLGAEGFFRWDGEQSNGSKARIGAYMVLFEVFDEKGVVRTFRKRVVVAGF